MFTEKFIEGRVIENKHWTEHLYSLRIQAEPVPFTAGQFGKLALDIEGQRIARPYSFVNAPDESIIEFYSSIVPKGPLSPRLAALKQGDRVRISDKGSGFLVLDEVPEGKYLWLLSTGTGVGPFLSILRTGAPWQRFERIVLVHAVRYGKDLSYQEVIKNLGEEHAGRFIMVSFISREESDFSMRGRIPTAIREGTLERRGTTPFNQDSQVMICGNPDMIKDSIAALEEKGLRKNRRRSPGHITVERYW